MATHPTIRKARPTDAEAVARIYVESWRDTYPLVLPARLLSSMTVEGQSARWRNAIAIAAREVVYVAEAENGKLAGMTSMGRARDSGLGYDAEIYTLYVDPMMTGRGIGRALLAGAFRRARRTRPFALRHLGACGKSGALLLRGHGRQTGRGTHHLDDGCARTRNRFRLDQARPRRSQPQQLNRRRASSTSLFPPDARVPRPNDAPHRLAAAASMC